MCWRPQRRKRRFQNVIKAQSRGEAKARIRRARGKSRRSHDSGLCDAQELSLRPSSPCHFHSHNYAAWTSIGGQTWNDSTATSFRSFGRAPTDWKGPFRSRLRLWRGFRPYQHLQVRISRQTTHVVL
ncbi:hypothetical protein PsYK624_062480 [Phanerochaete sordida]|uniref:Uncharacterized protein n=1 Tax=Phanerochaete sordida TaxID=48140 RepID=A0A9P3G8Z8_9APHY|nr:hypothetical protein PsYK624_062480 [Phanerochaete sordida]